MAFVRTHDVDIDAPAEEVFSFVIDLTRHPEWADQKMEVEHVAGPENGIGATYRTHVEIHMPVGTQHDDATVVVREAEAPHHVAYEATDGSGTYLWTIDLDAADGHTHVTQRCVRLDAPLWMRLVQPTLWRVMGHKMVENGLTNLRDRVEHANGA
jgi:uncharacterized protein YndB with AHSA1/START domain